MKYALLLALFTSAFAQLSALNVNYSYATFYAPDKSSLELYLQVDGRSVNWQRNPADTTELSAAVEISITVREGENIVLFDRYVLNSPVLEFPQSFVDQKRYGLPAGTYQLSLSARDVRLEENTWSSSTTVILEHATDKIAQSSIQLIDRHRTAKASDAGSYVKRGRFLEGLASPYLDRRKTKLFFYNEVYHADQVLDSLLYITYYLEDRSRKDRPVRYQERKRKKRVRAAIPLFYGMDITEVPSGNYQLVIELRTPQGELLNSHEVELQRSNPFFDPVSAPDSDEDQAGAGFAAALDSAQLRFALKALAPLLEDAEGDYIDALVNAKRVDAQRIYLESFWQRESPANPKAAYEQFDQVARSVHATYDNGFGYGFETDRGYLFMRYGKPDDIIREENDPNAPPYEMWVYYDFPKTRQSNVKFIFYNPSLAKNGFELLHSTARGQVNNPQWEVQLYSQSPGEIQGSNYIDATRMQDNVLRNARENFENL